MTKDPKLNLSPEEWRRSLPHYQVPAPLPVVIKNPVKQ